MKSFLRRPLAVAVVSGLAVLVIGASVVIGATVATNGGPVTNVRTKTATEGLGTAATTTPQDVSGMNLSVAVPAGQHAMFVITFSAQTYCLANPDPGLSCYVRVLFDGVVAQPGQVEWESGRDDLWKVRSMQFVAGPAGPGTHSIKVQFSVANTDTSFFMAARTLTVLRAQV